MLILTSYLSWTERLFRKVCTIIWYSTSHAPPALTLGSSIYSFQILLNLIPLSEFLINSSLAVFAAKLYYFTTTWQKTPFSCGKVFWLFVKETRNFNIQSISHLLVPKIISCVLSPLGTNKKKQWRKTNKLTCAIFLLRKWKWQNKHFWW